MTTTIAEYSKTEAALSELRSRYGKTFDVRTTAGMTEAREARRVIKATRTDLEAKRKELKAPALERCKQIDEEAKRITAELEKLEDPIDQAIKAEENRKEEEKKAAENAKRERYEAAFRLQRSLREQVAAKALATSTALREFIDSLALDYPDNEFAEETRMVIEQVKQQAQSFYEAALKREEDDRQREKDRAELEALRKQAAEDKRIADEARAKADREAEAARKKADDDARVVREQEAERLRVEREKLEAQQAEARKAEDDKRAAEAEVKRKADEEKHKAETEARMLAASKAEAMHILKLFLHRFANVAPYDELCVHIADFILRNEKAEAPAKVAKVKR